MRVWSHNTTSSVLPALDEDETGADMELVLERKYGDTAVILLKQDENKTGAKTNGVTISRGAA